MSYQITTLAENCVYGRKLQAEHGLSLYIETPTCKILFDTGASDLFIRNAHLMGIDLRQVDYLILSHGHSDHTGGLHFFLDYNRRATVVCKREIFYPKFKYDRENGIRQTEAVYDMTRFHFIDQQTELAPGIVLFPAIEIVDAEDTHFERFYVVRDGSKEPDTFQDELALVLVDAEGFSLVSACSHRGITNMLRMVRATFPHLPCQLLLGGFHIHNAKERKYRVIADYLRELSPRSLGVCHCTGIDKYALFSRDFGDRVFYNYTGYQLNQ